MINLRNHQDGRWRQRSLNLLHRLRRNDPTLRDISLQHGEQLISSPGIASIVQSLQNNTTVKILELTLAAPAEPLVDQQDESSSSGTTNANDSYDLSAVEVPARYMNDIRIAEFLQKTLEHTTSLDTVKISTSATASTTTNDAQWLSLSRGLTKNRSIRKLQVGSLVAEGFTQNCLSVAACRALGQILTENTKITSMCLQGLELENVKAVQLLACGIRQSISIRQLNLQRIECSSSADFLLLIDAIATTRAPLDTLIISECEFEYIDSASHDDDELGDYSEYSHSRNSCYSHSSKASLQQHPLALLASHPLSFLKEICITESIFNQDSFCALCQGLAQAGSVQMLDLTDNDLLGSDCAQFLSDMLAENTGLQKLILEENILLDRGVEVLCDGLSRNKSLRELSLKANHLTSVCCNALAACLTQCGLYKLVLSENNIGDVGAIELATGLSCTSTQLCYLNLDACLLSDAGIVRLCKATTSPSSPLEELCLANNHLQCEGARALSNMLSVNTRLASLDVSGCHVNNDAVALLLQSLTSSSNNKNTTLRYLNLAFNALTDLGASSIAQMLRANQSRLSMLSVQCNHFSTVGETTLLQSVKHNTYLKELYFWSPGNASLFRRNNGQERPDESIMNELLQKLHHWLALNKAGRCALQECAYRIDRWPSILEHADNVYGEDALYYLLREKPELMMYRNSK